MSKTKNIFNIDIPKFKIDLSKEAETYIPVSPKEYTDEILAIKKQQHVFDATNDHENYLVVVFSCKEDLKLFQKNAKIEENTFIDGYELAKKMNVEPKKPAIKLPISLDEKYKNRQQ
jgi:hypothetical protein